MKIIGRYSFNGGEEWFRQNASQVLAEIEQSIASTDAQMAFSKLSRETNRRRAGKTFYGPTKLNKLIKAEITAFGGWRVHEPKIRFQKAEGNHYAPGYEPPILKVESITADFAKDRVGVEVQFGKYAFLWFDILSKMVIFAKNDLIDAGIEIVPSHQMTQFMNSGPGSYEKIVRHLNERGASDIDIPVLVIGIEPDQLPDQPVDASKNAPENAPISSDPSLGTSAQKIESNSSISSE